MITKERLKELIEQGATIYHLGGTLISVVKLTENNEPEIKRDTMLYCYCYSSEYRNKMSFENLFETEEDAEFALRFKRIPKTEYLDLPTWEEFNEEEQWQIFNNGLLIYALSNEEKIVIYKLDNIPPCLSYQEHILYEFEHTKENYIEACELCRKLFLGEKV